MEEATRRGAIIVGVEPGRVADVVDIAVQVAQKFGVRVVCVLVDPGLLSLGNRADGSPIVESLDPDSVRDRAQELSEADRATISAISAARSVTTEIVAEVGDPVHALIAAANARDALMIVVGTHTGWHRLTEILNGSVAARLAHQQHRSVLVVPTAPIGLDHTPLGSSS